MSHQAPAAYIRDILQELADIQEFTAKGKQAFMLDRQIHKAVIRSYEVIGEIAKRLPVAVREKTASQIAWAQLIGFRDFLAHHYQEVILENVWQAVEDAPRLTQVFSALLTELESDKET